MTDQGLGARSAELIPQSLRQHLDTVRTMWSAGVFKRPRELALQLRNRAGLGRMQKAFLYQRYATATLLGRKLGIYDALSSGPLSSPEVAQRCSLLPTAADGLLRVLEGQGFVARQGERFCLTEFGQHWLTRDAEGSPRKVRAEWRSRSGCGVGTVPVGKRRMVAGLRDAAGVADR